MSPMHQDGFRDSEPQETTTKLIIPEMERILEAPKGAPDTYGATPLDRVATLSQQIALRTDLQELTYRDLPDDVPLEVIDYVHRTFAKRFNSRGEANEENFTTALHYEDYADILSEEEFQIVERARFGLASPAELLLVRELLGMKSIELACLTHPYGKNINDILPDMRSSVRDAVNLYGGVYFKNPGKIFKVKESLNDTPTIPDLSKGILMTRKRTIGRLPDGTIVKERSSFVLRTDPESGFDQVIITHLQAELVANPNLDWMQWLIDEARIDLIADRLLQNDDHTLAIPISSTIYAYNKKTSELVAAKKKASDDERRELSSMDTPAIYDAIYTSRDVHRARLASIALEGRLLTDAGMDYHGPMSDEEVRRYLSSLEGDS